MRELSGRRSFMRRLSHIAAIKSRRIFSNECYATVMQFIVEIPDNLADQMIPSGYDPGRAAVQGLAVEAYRAHRLTEDDLAGLLGMDRYELDGFLKDREVWLEYSAAGIAQELESSRHLLRKRRAEYSAASE
jgi:predicted HTH domain antitoxin